MLFLVSFVALFSSSFCLPFLNDRPVIGILAEETNSPFAPNATSYIMASYVKFLEFSGARVVPIMIRKPRSYYEDIVSKINGVLFPGGASILQSDGYGRVGKIIFNLAVKMNNNGDYFPLWGTCLGFELLNLLASKGNWMKHCNAEDLALNINLTQGFRESRLFEDLDSSLEKIMQSENATIHYHQWCLTPQNYSISKLDEFFKVLATNKDSKGIPFVNIIEAHKFPFYGVAFHPEKVLFEWIVSKTHHNIPHTTEAVRVSQFFSRFFVNEARKNKHTFVSKEEEDAVLIYNYNPVFTGKRKNYASIQNYYFP